MIENIKKICDIYCVGMVANLATKILIEKKYDELSNYFSKEYLDFAIQNVNRDNDNMKLIFDNLLNGTYILQNIIMPYIDKRNNKNIHIPNHELIDKKEKLGIFDIGKGGPLTTLWIISEATNHGLIYKQKQIPIRQEIVEISDYYELNSYRLLTENSKIILVENDIMFINIIDEILEKIFNLNYDRREAFKNRYIKNIGALTTGNKKQRIDVEQKSFLTKDYKDEIEKIICLEEK